MAGVDATIGDLRRAVHAQNDADLARKLGIDKSAISGWRARGNVPRRFLKMLNAPEPGSPVEAMQVGGEVQNCAQRIALVRFVLLRETLATSQDVDQSMRVFSELRPWWLVMFRAVQDLLAKVEALRIDLGTAQALLMQEDLRDVQATARRVEAQLAEDLADNPASSRFE